MAYLKYYQDEREKYKESFEQKVQSTREVEIITDKLLKHFKLDMVRIRFTSGSRHSNASLGRITINMEYGDDFGTICHELAHVYQAQKLHDSKYKGWHNKEHHKIFKRMINYCKKKDWFQAELQRRTIEKPRKIVSKDELKQKYIVNLELKIKQYEKKIKIYTNKLKKAKKSLKIRLKHLEGRKFTIGSPAIEDNGSSDTLVEMTKEEQDREENMNNTIFVKEIES
jgi:hypothetical protein